MDETINGDEILLDLVEEITNQLHAGQSVDLERYARDYPQYIDRLRGVLPSLELFAAIGSSDEATETDSHPTIDLGGQLEGCLGDYQIVREIGRGGMGVVYEATDRTLGRRAALKVLPFAAMLDPRQIQRFKNEAQAVAQLDHPHIVDVFGVGCDRGVHFYAMRLINGRTLSALIAALKAVASGDTVVNAAVSTDQDRQENASRAASSDTTSTADPSTAPDQQPRSSQPVALPGSLSTRGATGTPAYFRAVAEVIRQAAMALAHAHQNGVVHRDIKPSNLLIEDDGKLWVTDFGLAHIENAGTLTMTGDVVGTLRYMSPEQAQGYPVDHRSDIYSLGATLYELLTLRPAFPQVDRQELTLEIISGDPPTPRRQDASISSDLETIVLKTLEKDPAQRYQSAELFADDLLRFCEHRPIRARRPTLLDRTIKWSRRHRPLVRAVAAGLVIAGLSLITSTIFMGKMAHDATVQRNEADTQRGRAVANEQLALQVLDEMLLDVIEIQFPSKRLEPEDYALLEKALHYYEGFVLQNEQYTSSRRETANAYRRVGDIRTRLGQHAQAEEAYRKSIAHYEQLEQESSDGTEFRYGIAVSTNSLGHSLQSQNKLDEAPRAYRQALAMQSKLVEQFPDRPDYLTELARIENNLGVLLASTQQPDPAQEQLLLARGHWEQLARQADDPQPFQHYIATGHVNLAKLWLGLGRMDDAEEALQQAIQIERLLSETDDRSEYSEQLARSLNSYGVLLMRSKRSVDAETAFRESLPIWRDLAKQYPNVTEYAAERARTCNNLAALIADPQEALSLRTEARQCLELLCQQDPGSSATCEPLAKTCVEIGKYHQRGGDHEASKEAYERAMKIWRALSEDSPRAIRYRRELSTVGNLLGKLHSTCGRPAAAEAAYQEALRILDEMSDGERVHPGHREAEAKLCHNLGLLLASRDIVAAEPLLLRSQETFADLQAMSPANPSHQHALATSHAALGNLLYADGQVEAGREQLRQSLSLRQSLAEKYSRLAPMQNSLAWFLVSCADPELRDPDRGLVHARKAVTLSPHHKGYWNTLGVAQYRSGDFAEAIKSLKRSQSIAATSESSDLFFLAMAHHHLGEIEAAQSAFQRACQWMQEKQPDDLELHRFRTEATTILGIEDGAATSAGSF